MFKNLEKLVLEGCLFKECIVNQEIKKGGHLYTFSTKPYVPNAIRKLEFTHCAFDSAHFKEFVDLFPNLEELKIDLTERYHGEEYAFDTDSLKSDMDIFAQMKNLRTLKLLDVYEPAQDDSKSLVNLEMAMMVIRTKFSMETEVKISVGGSAQKEPNGTEYHRITTAGNFIPQNIKGHNVSTNQP